MSYKARKRRRAVAFPSEDDEERVEDPVVLKTDEPLEEVKEPGLETTDEVLEKELEIWDSFREEHYEAVEQLPLSLHRSFALMRELDEQADAYGSELLPILHQYIEMRRSLAAMNGLSISFDKSTECIEANMNNTGMASGAVGDGLSAMPSIPSPVRLTNRETERSGSPAKAGTPSDEISRSRSKSIPPTPSRMPIPEERKKPPTTTREMLSHIAWLSGEIVRASEEKVNLAQAAYDSVDRHVRLLDQAIAEQETSLTIGLRPGTHPAPIVLPSVNVSTSRLRSAQRATALHEDEDEVTIGMVSSVDGNEATRARKHDRRYRRKSMGTPGEEESIAPQVLSIPASDIPVDPHEPRYCYCNQVSFGLMIGCDNGDSCDIGWFHLPCVNLQEAPKGKDKWYCKECSEALGRTRNKRKK